MNSENGVLTTTTSKSALTLGKPSLHIMAAALFALVFSWPILAFDAPLNTWTFLYVSWAASIFLLFIFSKGEDAVESDDVEDDDTEAVASLPPAKVVSIRPPKES